MEVTVTARHCAIPDSVRDRTRRRFQRLERYDARVTSAIVNFEAARGKKSVEARLALAGSPPLLAHAESPTFRSALDAAIDRLERQLKRHRQRLRRRRTVGVRVAEESTTP